MTNQWNMPQISFNAQGEPHFDFPNAIKPPLLLHDPLAAPAHPHGNENLAPPAANAPGLQHWPHHPPAPPPAQPQPQRTFIQYQGPGLPPLRHFQVDAPPLQAVPSAVHGNDARNFAPAAYGYGGARYMPPMQQGAFDPAARPDSWVAYPMDAGHLGRASRRSQSRREREEEVSSGEESEEEKGKTKPKKRKRPTKKSEAKRGGARSRKGVGSKSGELHRRTTGASDEEISTLSEAVKHGAEPRLSAAQLKAAKQRMKAPVSEGEELEGEETDEDEDEDGGPRGLTVDEKLQAVEWLTTPEHYKNLRTSLESYCITMSQVLFEDRVSASQIARYWNSNAFKKYKAIRAQLPHTGGGDPDAARQDTDEQAASGSAERRPSDVTFTTVGKLSADSLLAFYNSTLYRLIDAVAHSDSAVERARKINSSDPILDSDTPKKRGLKTESPSKSTNTIDDLLQQAFRDMSERSKVAQSLERQRLELERRREDREEAEREDRRQIRLRQERRDARADWRSRWDRAMEMSHSTVEQLSQRGLKLIAELEEEEKTEKAAGRM
ncbi:hypothetical protein V8D89_008027 [Ganoderma adspersum]